MPTDTTTRYPENDALLLTTPLPLTMHPAEVYLSGLGEGSRRTMREALNAIASLLTQGAADARTLNWSALRYPHTALVRSLLMKKYSPATANKMLCALRRTLQEARRLGLIAAEDYAQAVDLKSLRGRRALQGRALSEEEIAALMAVCRQDLTPRGRRDAALIAILRSAGLRRSEVVKLRERDFKRQTRSLEILSGKGDRDRTVYLSTVAVAVVEDWLLIRGKRPGALLCPIDRRGLIEYRHLTPEAVLLIVKKRASQAGVESFSPHDFRRTFCSDLLNAGVDIVTVQKLAGHATPETTAKYDRRGEAVLRQAVEQLGLPYSPRSRRD